MNEVNVFNYHGNAVTMKTENGIVYVNLTEFAKLFPEKNLSSIINSKEITDYVSRLSEIRNLSSADLLRVTRGGDVAKQGTWAHQKVALRVAQKLSTNFAIWVDERIEELLKYGMTATQSKLEEMIANPDLVIGLATELKKEREEKAKLELQNQKLVEDNQHKKDVIEGLIYEIPLADMRQRINQIVRGDKGNTFRGSWHLLYSEFERKYHLNIGTRMNNMNYSGNKMDYIETELKMIPEMYDMACKIFEGSYSKLMKEWSRAVRRACKYN